MDEVDKDTVVYYLTREDISKPWSIDYLLGWYGRDILVWHHRLNHFSLRSLLRLSKRVIIPSNISSIRKLPPCVACLFVKSHKRPWITKGKFLGNSIRKTSETRPDAMTSIYQMVSAQPVLLPQVTGYITYAIF